MVKTDDNKTKGYNVIPESILTPVNCVCERKPEVDTCGTETFPSSFSCDCSGIGKKVLAKNRMDALTEWRELIRGLQNIERNGVHETANIGQMVTFNQTK